MILAQRRIARPASSPVS
ncbi:hypothetical protein A2U01_0091034, partial [Trifolium medium]|nr:hypothetical protein [Trifolium medium]